MKRILSCAAVLGALFCGLAGLALTDPETLLVRTIKGNSGIIYALAFSPDGKNIASGGIDTLLKIWSAEDGSLVKALRGHRNFINAVAYSPDGRTLASAGEEGLIKIWDAGTGLCRKTLKGHGDSISSLAFFPDGQRLASASNDGTVRLWRLGAKAAYRTIATRSGYVYSVAVSSDGTRVASGGAGVIKLWDAESGERRMTFEGHGDAVNSVAFSRAANYLASAGEDGLTKVWRLSDGICVKTFAGQRRPLYTVAYSPDGNNVFSGGGDDAVSVWRVSDGMLVRTFAGHSRQVKSAAVSGDGKFMASGGYDKSIKLWLTPWEADRRDKEAKDKETMELERNKNYEQHYNAGNQFLSAPTKANLTGAVAEFTQARTFKDTKACQGKLAGAVEALRLKEEEIERNTNLALTAGSSLAVLLIIIVVFLRRGKKAKLRATLPEDIKNETLAGSYERALGLYAGYKSLGGDPRNLPRVEMLELYRGLKALGDLPRENLPYEYLLSYANVMVSEGNYKMALTMLRSGRLLDAFKSPAEFDTFVDIYTRAGRPDSLLLLKLNPEPYSALAEALFRANDFELCEKMCGLKKQFYAGKLTPGDNELLAACRTKREELEALKKNRIPKWRCINCGHTHEGQSAPESCPGCMHPRDHFQLVSR